MERPGRKERLLRGQKGRKGHIQYRPWGNSLAGHVLFRDFILINVQYSSPLILSALGVFQSYFVNAERLIVCLVSQGKSGFVYLFDLDVVD